LTDDHHHHHEETIMAATQADVRRALLDANPYKLEDLDHAAEIAMAAADGSIATAGKMLKNAAKGNNPGHFGLPDRALRVIARIGAAPEAPEPAAEPIPPTKSEQDEDPGPPDEDAAGIDPFADDEPELAEDEQEALSQAMDKDDD